MREINSWSVSVKVHLSHPGGFNFLHSTSWSAVDEAGFRGNYNWKALRMDIIECWFICVLALCSHIAVFVPAPPQRLTLLHVNSNQCLDMPSEEDKMVPTLRDCNNSRSQQWLLRNMTLSDWSPQPPPYPTTTTAIVRTSPDSPRTHQVAPTTHIMRLSLGQPDQGIQAADDYPLLCTCLFFADRHRFEREAAVASQVAMTGCGCGHLVVSTQGEWCARSVHEEHCNDSSGQSASC